MPACHNVAKSCQENKECREKMDSYDHSCAVDPNTQKCVGSFESCRKAMINILGTQLRTSCACEGTAADFRELYDCFGWHRHLWVNPCVGK